MRHWDDLRVFLACARSGGLTGAGKVLKMDPATVSRRITRLERETGTALFVKSVSGYTLTEAGQRMRAHLDRAEGAIDTALGAVSGAGAGLSGVVRIGAPDGCANYLLPQVCTAIQRDHPGLDLQILALPRIVNLSQREADLAIAVSRPKTDRLRAVKLTDYRLSLAASRSWLADNGAPARAEDLHGMPMIGYIPDMIFDAELDYLGALGVTRVPLASNSVSVQLNLARAGGGLAVVHDFALPAAPDLVRVLPDQVALHRTFWLVRHAGARDARLDRLAALLVAGLRAEVQRLEAAAAV